MGRPVRRSLVALAALAALAPGRTALAQLSTAEASILTQSTATDTDAVFLAILTGTFFPPQTLVYTSTGSATGWTGDLSGTYAGQALSLSYVGDLTAYPGGAITWTTDGTYGADTWPGGGSLTLVQAGPKFSVDVDVMMDVRGADSLLYGSHYTIPGQQNLDGSVMFGTPGDPEAGMGTMDKNGLTIPNSFSFSFAYGPGLPTLSDVYIKGQGLASLTPLGAVFNTYTARPLGPEAMGSLSGVITTVPEPSTFALLGLGAAAAWPALRRRAGR